MSRRLKTAGAAVISADGRRRHGLTLLLGILAIFLLPAAAKSGWQEDWNETLARARREGKVSLATTIPGLRNAVAGFQKQFGLELQVNVFGSNSKLDALATVECTANQFSMDVLLGGPTELTTLYPRGCLAPIKTKLILPEVTDQTRWKGGLLKWNDPEGQYILQTGEYVSGRIAVNTEKIKTGAIVLARDLLKPEFRGKITSYDPRLPGLGNSMAGYFLTVFGPDFVRQLYIDQKTVFISDYRLLGEWIARGTHLIGLGALERFVEPFRKQGLPVGFIAFDDAPGYVTGGASLIKLVKGSPHPYAAAVLVNWLASKEGQEAYSLAALQPSRRVDVQVEGIPDYMVPKPGIKYIDAHSYEHYVKKRGEIDSALKRIIGDR